MDGIKSGAAYDLIKTALAANALPLKGTVGASPGTEAQRGEGDAAYLLALFHSLQHLPAEKN